MSRFRMTFRDNTHIALDKGARQKRRKRSRQGAGLGEAFGCQKPKFCGDAVILWNSCLLASLLAMPQCG